jgi:hypothetical protein
LVNRAALIKELNAYLGSIKAEIVNQIRVHDSLSMKGTWTIQSLAFISLSKGNLLDSEVLVQYNYPFDRVWGILEVR